VSDLPYQLEDPSQQMSREYETKKQLEVGKSKLTLSASTRVVTNGDPFDIRFVNRSWDWCNPFSYETAAVSTIRITGITVPEWEAEEAVERDFVGPNEVTKSPNGVGGFVVTTRKPKRWVIGQRLWIELEIEAHKPWRGKLSFEGQTDRKGYGRMPIRVKKSIPDK